MCSSFSCAAHKTCRRRSGRRLWDRTRNGGAGLKLLTAPGATPGLRAPASPGARLKAPEARAGPPAQSPAPLPRAEAPRRSLLVGGRAPSPRDAARCAARKPALVRALLCEALASGARGPPSRLRRRRDAGGGDGESAPPGQVSASGVWRWVSARGLGGGRARREEVRGRRRARAAL